MFKLREMREADREPVFEFCKKIWDGDDYMFFVFDEWLEDDAGEFTAVELDGNVVGAGKLSFVAPRHAWLEGLRSDIELKQRGMGTAVTRYYLQKLKDDYDELESIRFATYFQNTGSIKISERHGFEVLATLSVKTLDMAEENFEREFGDTDDVVPITDVDKVWNYIQKTNYFEQSHEMITIGWIAYPLTKAFIQEEYIDKDHCYGILEDGEIRGLVLWGTSHYDKTMCLSLLYSDESEKITQLIDFILKRAESEGKNFIEIMAPDMILEDLNENGFSSWEQEHDFLLYEFPLEKLEDVNFEEYKSNTPIGN